MPLNEDAPAALLRLARSREGALRLVTTNFDRVFHAAAKCTGQVFQPYAAPMLPIPKNSRWDGLVYLHGLLPRRADDTVLNRLVVTSSATGSQWDDVMFHLAHWLTRHLDDPRLILWIAQRGGRMHDRWPRLIEHELDCLASLEREGKTAELEDIRSQAPKAVCSPLMRMLWRLLLSGRVKSSWHDPDLYRWKDRLKREGLTTTLRLELRELLAPQVVSRKRVGGLRTIAIAGT